MRGLLIRLATGASIATLLTLAVRAQTVAPITNQSRKFEVVSIKPHGDNKDRFPGMRTSNVQPGRYVANNLRAVDLVLQAFRTAERRLRPEEIVSVPGWASTSSFDILATVDLSREEIFAVLPALLHALLEDRFKLTAHIETRPLPVYALVFARSDSRLGPQLRRTATNCEAYALDRKATPPTPAAFASIPCDAVSFGAGRITARGVTLTSLSGSLSGSVNRTVINETGLTERFDADLQWAPDQTQPNQAAVPEGPSIFTAIQEQLGLKLESRQAPRDVVVIDHIEQPTPN